MRRPISLLLTCAALLGAAAPASAQPRLSAQSIIVNPVPTPLKAQVWVDRDPTGTRTPSYRIGQEIRISTRVNENAYVYLFNVNPDGSVDQILPNRLSASNYVRAGQVRMFPAQGDNFVFNVSGPLGVNRVLVVASRRPLNLNELSTYSGASAFATVQADNPGQFAQALSIVVNPVAQPIPQQDWISDTVTYTVRR